MAPMTAAERLRRDAALIAEHFQDEGAQARAKILLAGAEALEKAERLETLARAVIATKGIEVECGSREDLEAVTGLASLAEAALAPADAKDGSHD